MDKKTIQAELEALQKKTKKYEKVDRTKVFWKPKVGKSVIRIVPSKEDSKNPFKKVFVHYGIGKFPMMALSNYGDNDPIIEFAQKLKKNNNKEDWQLAKKLEPKMRVYAQVIVRGEEDLGVRLWEFGKEIYTELLGIGDDEDYGDYTSITDGRDLTIETVGKDVTGNNYNKSTVRVKPNKSQLSEDASLVSLWLTEQKDILSLYPKQSYDDMLGHLQSFLSTPIEEEQELETDETESEEVIVTSSTPNTGKISKSKSFEDLFNK